MMQRHYYHKNSRHNRPKPPPFSPAFISQREGMATIHSQTENVGYGFTRYQIVGTMQEVSLAVDEILFRYPTNPYGTRFNWPPNTKKAYDGSPLTHEAATDLGNGLWHLTGSHSNTSD